MNTYTLDQIKRYLSSQDSMGDIWYNINRIDEILAEPEKITTGIACPRCDNEEGEEGTCPYDEDINDKCTECNCCSYCRQQCADDI